MRETGMRIGKEGDGDLCDGLCKRIEHVGAVELFILLNGGFYPSLLPVHF